MRSRTAFVVWVFLLGLAWPVAAQQTVDVGSISGRVLDASGSAVPGALITATHEATNVATTATSDALGRFRFQIGRAHV